MGGDAMRAGPESSTGDRLSLWTKVWTSWGRRGASLWTNGAGPGDGADSCPISSG